MEHLQKKNQFASGNYTEFYSVFNDNIAALGKKLKDFGAETFTYVNGSCKFKHYLVYPSAEATNKAKSAIRRYKAEQKAKEEPMTLQDRRNTPFDKVQELIKDIK